MKFRVSVFVGILSLVFGLDFLLVEAGAIAEFGRVEPLSQSQPPSLGLVGRLALPRGEPPKTP